MSSITSGIGLSSGLDIAALIEQLLSLDARRAIPIQSRIDRATSVRAALQQSRSLLLSLRTASTTLASPSVLAAQTIASSHPSILGAIVGGGGGLAPGSTSMLVRSIATATRLLSGPIASPSAALGAKSLTLRFGTGRLVEDRALADLHAGAGIERGRIRITDRSGATATIDLRHALSIDEVLDAINGDDSIGIEARLRADGRGMELVDASASTGSITVQEWGGGGTAASLGLLGSSEGKSSLVGTTIAYLAPSTALESIGTGVPIVDGEASFVVRVDGDEIAVHLGAGPNGSPPRAATLGDAVDRINAAIAAAGHGATASVSIADSGDRLAVSYTGGGTLAFLPPASATDSGAPALATLSALGLAGIDIDGSAPNASTTHVGARILFGMHDVSLASLDGGAGLALEGSLTLVDAMGRSATIGDFGGVDSIESLLAKIRGASDAAGMELDIGVDASGTRLRVRDPSNGGGSLVASGAVADALDLAPGGGSDTILSRDLRRADIGLGTPLARIAGKSADGTLSITSRSGATATIALSAGMTVLDLSRAAAESGLPISIGVNEWGDALVVVDHSNGPAMLTVADSSGGAAAALRIAGASVDGRIDGTRTRTVALNGGEGAEAIATLLDGLGVDASLVVGDDGALRMEVLGLSTGAANDLSLSIVGADLDWTTAVRARDARVLLSPEQGAGTLVTSATNELHGVLPGAILQLKAASDDVVTVTVSPSNQPIIDAVSAFVNALKSAMAQLRQATAVDPDAGTRGALYGNIAATRAREALRSLVGSSFGPDGRRLSRLGITVAGDGTVTFDQAALAAALEDDPDAVRAQLAETDGIAPRFDAALGAFVEPEDGAFEADDSRLVRLIESANATIDRINDGLARRRAVLLARFTAMELAIERLRAQQSTMQSLLAGVLGS